MKKATIFITIVLLLMNYSLIGQTFGISAGTNFSNILDKDVDLKYSEEYKTKIGYNYGVTFEVPISKPLTFETGLIVSTKGFKMTNVVGNNKTELTHNPYYVIFPLHLRYSFQLGSIKPYAAFGPYIGFGISGKYNVETTIENTSTTVSNAINWGNENNSNYRKFDGGLDFGAGIEIGNFRLGALYSLGLVNICPMPNNDRKYNTRCFSISVGYKFAK